MKRWPGDDLIVVVNTDPHAAHETHVQVPVDELGLGQHQPYQVVDLLTNERYTWQGPRNFVRLDPSDKVGHVLRVVGRDAEA